MPVFLLAAGVLLSVIFLLRLRAQGRRTGDYGALSAVLTIAGASAVIAFFLMGRWPVALFLLGAMIVAMMRLPSRPRAKRTRAEAAPDTAGAPLTRAEALTVLGLGRDASEEEIAAAYRSLMAKVHPDHNGSAWMAAQLNRAREALAPKPGEERHGA